MIYEPSRSVSTWFKMTVAIVLPASMIGLAFAMWFRHGTEMFVALAQAGFSWCF